MDLEDLVTAVYAAIDDALAEAGIVAHEGKLIPRRGPAPAVDDREVLCLAMLQELLDFESDHAFYSWFEAHPVMRQLFPRRLSRPNWADRRALLTPLMERLSQAFCALDGEGAPPFSSSTRTPSTSAGPSALDTSGGSTASSSGATARRSDGGSKGCAST
jgi:hypothetical protein